MIYKIQVQRLESHLPSMLSNWQKARQSFLFGSDHDNLGITGWLFASAKRTSSKCHS
jgi:hypothetical protein